MHIPYNDRVIDTFSTKNYIAWLDNFFFKYTHYIESLWFFVYLFFYILIFLGKNPSFAKDENYEEKKWSINFYHLKKPKEDRTQIISLLIV